MPTSPITKPKSEPTNPQPPNTPPKTPTLTLTSHTGSLFAAPSNTVLIHACNTRGTWGAGIARTFKTLYPRAYAVYRAHCRSHVLDGTSGSLTGTCLLIPPCEDPEKGDGEEKEKQHWIACLFTSAGYGKRKDGPDVILENSGKAMRDLLGQVERLGCLAAGEGDELEGKREEGNGGTKRIAGLRMCRINSGLFGVEWERTEAVLSGIELEEGWPGEVEVWWMED